MTTPRRSFLSLAARTGLLLATTTLSSAAASAAPRPPARRPNIVVILIDDMGFSDLGCYGSEIPTPNIDALAKGGLRFTQFYNTARCSPSRAALLTGTYPHQAGMGHLENFAIPGSRGLHGKLDDRVVTFAETLGTVGYQTGAFGKWHLGISHGVGPWQRGFQHSLVSATGGIYYPDQPQPGARTLWLDGRELPSGSPEIGQGEWYSSDLFVDHAAKFATNARAEGKPFLIYLPFVAVHFPVMAKPEDIARFRGHYRENWDTLRAARLARQKVLGIVPETEKLPPRLPNTYDWDKLDPQERDRFDEIMAIYAADIVGMDRAVGRLVDSLRAQGTLDDTLILIMSDNGGNAESGPDGRLEGTDPGSAHSTVFCGMNWASLENTPFQWFKHFTREGGISTPLIAHWPNGIRPGLNGSLLHEPGHLIDVMPTLLELSGASYPRTNRGQDVVPLQGRSLVPAFSGHDLPRKTPLYWEHEGNRAIRIGNWKLVARQGEPWELYDLTADRSETENLAARFPGRAKAMADQWDVWAEASFVDVWQDSFEPHLKRHRQNWGGGEIPAHPEASDQTEVD